MKSTMCIIVTLFFCTANLFSQDKFGAELSEIRKHRNQIDLDIKTIFNGLYNSTLLYKRTYQTGNLVEVNAIKLIRFGLGINSEINFDNASTTRTDSLEVIYQPGDQINFNLSLGWEKQKMHKNFVHYFGFDAVFQYYENSDNFYGWYQISNPIPFGKTPYGRAVVNYEAGLNPFFGIKYYFTDRISIGIETGLSVHYYSEKVTQLLVERKAGDGGLFNHYSEGEVVGANGIRMRFNNLRFLTLGYTF